MCGLSVVPQIGVTSHISAGSRGSGRTIADTDTGSERGIGSYTNRRRARYHRGLRLKASLGICYIDGIGTCAEINLV